MPVVRIEAGALDADAFAPFGWLPVDDTDPADGTHTLAYEWGDPHCNVIGHAPDEVARTSDGALVCARLYRHAFHTQVLMPMNVDAVVAVAAPDVVFTAPTDAEAIRAFHLQPGDVIVLHRGTWHWGPYPLGPEPVRLLNVQSRGYLDDNVHVDLEPATGASVEVVTGPAGAH